MSAADQQDGDTEPDHSDRVYDTVQADVTIVVVDLFAGGGGFSHGLAQACEELRLEPGVDVELHAINHSEAAIETHEANHPWANHYHAKIEAIHPPDVAEPGEVDILSGGPSCTHHSTARGGKPINEQMRASAWNVLKWVEQLQPEHVLLENVPDFRTWDKVDPETQESPRNGVVYESFCGFLEDLGLSVARGDHKYEYGRVLRCSNFGDPTTRRRLFVIASRNHEPSYPAPTHAEDPDPDSGLEPWVPASECIDWSDLGSSLWTRDLELSGVTPLKNSTMRRVAEGIRRHCDPFFEPLADAVARIGNQKDVEEDNDIDCTLSDLRERVVPQEYAGIVADAVDEPFLVRCPGGRVGLTSPYVLRQQSGGVPSPVAEDPLPTVSKAGSIGLVNPIGRSLVTRKNGMNGGPHSNPPFPPEEEPFHTITADPRAKLATVRAQYLAPGYSERPGQRPRTRSVDRPLMTVPGSKSPAALTTAFIDDFEGPADPISEPLGTLTARDRFALCVPEMFPWGLDLRYRMLKASELKQAQGFPEDYELAAETDTKKKELIGNAVPVNTAKALFRHLLTLDNPNLAHFGGGMTGEEDVEIPDYSEVVSDD